MFLSLFLRTACAAALLASASACTTTATPYQPYRGEAAGGVHGGYSETRLSQDRYLVRFHGNSLTSRDRVEGYLLYRAAELTVQNGYDWFLIVDRHTEHDVKTYEEPDLAYRPVYGPDYPYWRPHWRYYRPGYGWDVWHPEFGTEFWAERRDVTTVESFEAEAEIAFGKGLLPPNEVRAIDARKAMAEVGPTVIRPQPL